MTKNEDHQAQPSQGDRAEDQREVTELQTRLTPTQAIEQRPNPEQAEERELLTPSDHVSGIGRFKFVVKRFWTHQVLLTVSHDDCRDHFGTKWHCLPLHVSSMFLSICVSYLEIYVFYYVMGQRPPRMLFASHFFLLDACME